MAVDPAAALRAIKLLHTTVWAALVAVIIAIPILAWQDRFAWAAVFTAIMLVEVAVLALNGMRCPLTDLAARFTDDRRANFDIYLPLWLAANNKRIFGSVFVAGLVLAAVRWLGR
jgi:succinate dehydrogenase hydrophobic anchor subunit